MYFKKLIIFVVINLLFGISYIFAATNVDLSLNSEKLDINDSLVLEVNIMNDDNSDMYVKKIEGIDDFDVIGKSQTSNFQSINGITKVVYTLKFNLKAKESGKYTLGPVLIEQTGEEKEYGDPKTVEITGDKIFIGDKPILPSSGDNTKKEDVQESKKSDFFQDKKNNSFSGKTSDEEVSLEDIDSGTGEVKDLDGNPMKDIYDIKKNNFISPINMFLSLFYILFFVVVYFLYKLYLKQKERVIEKVEKIVEERKIIDYSKLLREVEEKYIGETKEIFYAKLSEVIRLYLDDKIRKGLSTKTLKEIKGKVSDNLYVLIEKIYFPEYDDKQDSLEQREDVLKQTKNILK